MGKIIDSINYDGEKIITSYDYGKVWALFENGKKFFCKKTTLQELETNLLMAKNISNQKIVIANKEYTLAVPHIYDWDKNVLTMDYFDGINLEFMLRNKETYNFGIQILNELLKFFIYNNLYWIDFAPRNILINNNKINFVDFEKGIGRYSNIKEYLRNYVYEEYGSFSFSKDRIFTPDEIFDGYDEDAKLIHYVSDIGSKRIRAVAEILGIEEKLTHMEYLQIIKMFIIAEEPKVINNNYTFPRIMLENILKDRNMDPEVFGDCARKILIMNRQANNPFIKKYEK